MDWTSRPNFPRPDFLSSSRKRLAPQLMFKGGILNAWNKKMAVALDGGLFDALPELREVGGVDAEIAWIVYDLRPRGDGTGLHLQKSKVVYTKFQDALNVMTRPKIGGVGKFMETLQEKIDAKLESPPDHETVEPPFGK